jgi:1-phosphatidylinositol-3-phosphate 5-kinase
MVLKLTKNETKKGQPVIDILEVNRLKRQMLLLSYLWDQRLISATDSTKNKVEPISNSSARSTEDRSNESPSDELEHESVDGKRSKGNHENAASLQGYSSSGPESGSVIRRVLSDGEFPSAADISDTLDAKWRGEGGKVLFELASLGNTLLCLTDDRPKSFAKIPFSLFYDSLNKYSSGLARLNNFGEYNPVYVKSFQDLSRRQGGVRLLLPLGVNATVIHVFDDEPTSIISYALVSRDYHSQLYDELVKPKEIVGVDPSVQLPMYDSGNFNPLQLMDDLSLDSFKIASSMDDPISSTKASHIKVSFEENGPLGKAKFTVLCYYAKCFEAIRKKCCPSEIDFVRSLSRCKNWGAQGGKSNVFFAKSLDDRFIIKQVTKTELESFMKFAPEYFKYLSESISTGSPTCLAKIIGIYQVSLIPDFLSRV